MAAMSLDVKIEELVEKDRRYAAEAYHFVFEALDFAMQDRRHRYSSRHVGVPELLDSIRGLALQQFGPLARCVFESWRVYETTDFGEIVFTLIAHDLLNQSDTDRKEDFAMVFSFREVFEESYRPCVRTD